ASPMPHPDRFHASKGRAVRAARRGGRPALRDPCPRVPWAQRVEFGDDDAVDPVEELVEVVDAPADTVHGCSLAEPVGCQLTVAQSSAWRDRPLRDHGPVFPATTLEGDAGGRGTSPVATARSTQAARRYSWISPPSTSTRCTD